MSRLIVDSYEYHDEQPTKDLSYKRLVSVSDIRTELRINGGETPTAVCRIDNGDGMHTAILAGMLRKEATVTNQDGITLSGLVRSIRMGEDVDITIEAGI